MKRTLVGVALFVCCLSSAERINHAGRILGVLNPVTTPTQFNTPAADAFLGAMQIYPRTSAWNEDISNRPLLSNSAAMIAMVTSELASNRRIFHAFFEMNFVLVPDSQPLVPISFVDYPDESDPGPYPIPTIQPIETWPISTGTQTLDEWQRDVLGIGGDRHGIIVQPGNGNVFETWQMLKNADQSWQASNGAKFNLNSNAQRPLGWTSGDAAGLSMFPALVRYDEIQRGAIEHAMRLVVKHTRIGYLYPASHNASSPATSDVNVPAMGQRFRLKSSFVIPNTWTREAKAIAVALKKYGAIVADNGNFFQISVTPDDRWPSNCFDPLTAMTPSDFEVVQSTSSEGGPRSPNPPLCNAGADKSGPTNTPISLSGTVSGGTTTPTTQWYLYAGPGSVSFGNAASPVTTAQMSVPGVYTLMLKASDGVHTDAYDAVVVTVTTAGALANLTFSPNPVTGGLKTTGTVTLTTAAPVGGASVALTDNLAALTLPATVNVSTGQTSGSFQGATSAVTTGVSGTVTASYAGSTRTTSFVIYKSPTITAFSFSPSSVFGTASSIGTVTLSSAAPVGGMPVQLVVFSTAMSVPVSLTIGAGATTGTFVAHTFPVATLITPSATASVPGNSRNAPLTVMPPALGSISFDGSTVAGGQVAAGTVRLNVVAPAVGSVVNLSSNRPQAVVPATVTVNGGASQASFLLTTSPVVSNLLVTVTANRLGVNRTATITILAP